MENRWIRRLVFINLVLLVFILIGRVKFFGILVLATTKAFLVPILLAALIFYIIRPLNNIFILKGIREGRASFLTLLICTFILGGLLSYFGKYAYMQFGQVTGRLRKIMDDRVKIDGFVNWLNGFVNVKEVYSLTAGSVRNYMQHIGQGFMRVLDYFMNAFSMVFLIIVIVFYMLKDGNKFKSKIVELMPERYKNISGEILSESDTILSHYVTGQAKVALSLAAMICIGYKIIGMPSALLLSTITFVLAFIPFVGFFISMIIPVVIALSMGLYMFLKLLALFIIVQTLKGRVVVPAIMAKSMNIHPLTDIFLVIGAIAVAGPFAAFAVVPVYAILKNALKIIKKYSEMT